MEIKRTVKRDFTSLQFSSVQLNSEEQFNRQGAVQRQVEFQLREFSSSWSSGA
jgi:hypothetical protein